MWDLPGPGIEPMSPAFAGRFLTTEPPREVLDVFKHLLCAQSQADRMVKAHGMVSALPQLMPGATYENEQQLCIGSRAKLC